MSDDEADPQPQPRLRRSFATWIKLLVVWAIGLVIWAGYLAVIVLLLVRVLS